MSKWIVAVLVVGFVSLSARAEDKADHSAAPSVEKKEEVKSVEDKSDKLFKLISACMVGTPVASADATTLVK